MMSTGRDAGLSGCRIYVVDDSLGAICLSRLCPQFRCQPKVGVLADGSVRREASSLIGRVTFGRCTVLLHSATMGAAGWPSPYRCYA